MTNSSCYQIKNLTRLSRDNKILLVIVFLGFVLRLNSIGGSFWLDEAISANLANSVLENGLPQNSSGDLVWRGFLNIYAMAFLGQILGASEFSFRMVSVIFSILTILLTYKFSKKIFNAKVGLLAAFLLSIFSWQISWSVQARMYAMFQFFYLLSIYSYYRLSTNFNYFNALLSLFSTMAAISLHITGYILPFVLFFYLSIVKANYFKKYIPISTFALIIFFSTSWSKLHLSERLVFSRYHVQNYLNVIYQNTTDFILPTMLASFYLLLFDKRKNLLLFSLAVIPASCVYIFFQNRSAARYLYFTVPLILILSSKSIVKFSSLLNSDYRNHIMLLLAVLLSINFYIFGDYELENHEPRLNFDIPDHKSAYAYIEEHKEDGAVVVTYLSPSATYYLGRPPNKTILTNDSSFIDQGRDVYSGTEVITTPNELEEYVNNEDESVWLVLSHKEITESFQDSAEKKLSEPVFEAENITIWRFNAN